MKTLLTIAGYDPSSGAGMTADLAVFAAHRNFGVSAITALTVQSTVGIESVEAVPAGVLERTLAVLTADLPPAGVKIGMLANAANVRAVAQALRSLHSENPELVVVLDPVLRSSSGRELFDAPGLAALHEELLPLVGWVTPNQAELQVLAPGGAAALMDRYPRLQVVVTGGDSDGEEAVDWVFGWGTEPLRLAARKIASTSTHGTGCAFSSALLCGLVSGLSGEAAARAAKEYVGEAIRRAPGLGSGKGPMHLLWPLDSGA